jgi:hypothetical protein
LQNNSTIKAMGSRYHTKLEIQKILKYMHPVAADAAKYFADLLIEHSDLMNNQKACVEMGYVAMAKALSEAYPFYEPAEDDVAALYQEHGEQIVSLAIAMVFYLEGKQVPSFRLK